MPCNKDIIPRPIKTPALVKKACALANQEPGDLDAVKAQSVMSACDEIALDVLTDRFFTDALQGAGEHACQRGHREPHH